jgi:DNA-binding transcriptional ArsR family regulator
MPHRRAEFEGLEIRAKLWHSIIEILKDGHRIRLPGRRFGPDVLMFLTYGQAIVSYSQGKAIRATDLARHLEIPRETARRHLRHLAELGLLEQEGKTFRPARRVKQMLGLDKAVREIKQAAAAVGLL